MVTQVQSSIPLRRVVLAVSLLDRGSLTDIEPRDFGVVVPRSGDSPLLISWDEISEAVSEPDLPDSVAQRRLARWLRLRLVIDALLSLDRPDRTGPECVLALVRPRALPREHSVHPGPAWPLRQVLGGALDLGLALRGYDDDGSPDGDGVCPLPPGVLIAAGVSVELARTRAFRYLADMAELGCDRLRRVPLALLRPLGDADIPTLLASPEFRTAVLDGQGMRSAAIPTLRRGWLDLGRLDPAFVPAAAELTDPDQRGFPRPVLITADEVTLVREGGDIVRQSLADPVAPEHNRPVSRGA